MPKLKPYIALFLFFCTANAFSQDNAWYIYLDDLESEAVEYSFGADNKGASFYIYYEGYETETKRDSIEQSRVKERRENRFAVRPPIPESGMNFMTSNPPEKLSSINGLCLVSPKQYREVKVNEKVPRYIYVITPADKSGEYLKWRVVMHPAR